MLPDISGKKSPYKAVEKFSKAVYGTTGGTCSARDFRPVMGNMDVHTVLPLKQTCAGEIFCPEKKGAKC